MLLFELKWTHNTYSAYQVQLRWYNQANRCREVVHLNFQNLSFLNPHILEYFENLINSISLVNWFR